MRLAASWRKLPVVLLLAILGISITVTAAQLSTSTPFPAIPLAFNETVTGVLPEGGEVRYAFDVPSGQDVVVAYDADKVVMNGHCITFAASSPENEACTGSGGGGGDGPVSMVILIPGIDQEFGQPSVELIL